MSERPYSKVFHELADEYPEVYDGPDLAAYVRLLVAANQAWPSSARWAGYASRPEITRLAECGLVLVDGSRYRMKGLDKERNARSNAASNAARTRWGNADGNAETMPHRVTKNRVEQSKDADGIFDAYYQLTARPPSKGVIDWLNRLCEEYVEADVIRALAEEHAADSSTSTLLGRAQTRLADDFRREQQRIEDRAKRQAIEERKRIEAMPIEQRAANQERLANMLKEAGLT